MTTATTCAKVRLFVTDCSRAKMIFGQSVFRPPSSRVAAICAGVFFCHSSQRRANQTQRRTVLCKCGSRDLALETRSRIAGEQHTPNRASKEAGRIEFRQCGGAVMKGVTRLSIYSIRESSMFPSWRERLACHRSLGKNKHPHTKLAKRDCERRASPQGMMRFAYRTVKRSTVTSGRGGRVQLRPTCSASNPE